MSERSEAQRRWDREHPRREEKRQWDHEHKGLGAGNACVDCGTAIWRKNVRCGQCFRDFKRAPVDGRRAWIAERWLAGAPIREIAQELGWTTNYVGVEMATMRRDGWELPYRYAIRDGKRVAA